MGGRVPKDVLWNAEKKWMTRRWELALGGDGVCGYDVSGQSLVIP